MASTGLPQTCSPLAHLAPGICHHRGPSPRSCCPGPSVGAWRDPRGGAVLWAVLSVYHNIISYSLWSSPLLWNHLRQLATCGSFLHALFFFFFISSLDLLSCRPISADWVLEVQSLPVQSPGSVASSSCTSLGPFLAVPALVQLPPHLCLQWSQRPLDHPLPGSPSPQGELTIPLLKNRLGPPDASFGASLEGLVPS